MRILVVEDEVRMASMLKRGLEEEGYSIDLASDGSDGLWMGSENPYDAIVLDVNLPGINGFEVCRGLRQRERWAPVIMLTARGDPQDRIHGLDAGADDYLMKPFSFGELTARLRALIRRGAPPRPVILTVGDLQVDPVARRARRGTVELDLSPKEFAVLELFVRHPGELLTRTRILEHAWDFAYDGVSNVVDQYVGYLRRKIDKPFGRNDLETVRGAGYRLRIPTEA